MRYFIIFIICLLFSCSNSITGDSSFDKVSNIPVIYIEIEGKSTKFIIDSGASFTTLDKEFADQINLNYFYNGNSIVGIGGNTNSYISNGVKVEVLNSSSRISMRISDLSSVVNSIYNNTGTRISGILGGDFLSSNGCIINYKTSKLECGLEN